MRDCAKPDGSREVYAPYLQWDEFCDVLGGARWEQAHEVWVGAGLSPERRTSLYSLAPLFLRSRQFLLSEGGPCHPLEIFWLKWNLFTSLCRKVLAVHRDYQRPHLGLCPAQVRVRVASPVDDWLPVRWLFAVELADTAVASSFLHDEMPSEMAQSLFIPPHQWSSLVYAPPITREWPLGREEPATVLIRSLDRIHEELDGEVRGLLRVHLISSKISGSEFSERDVFRLTFSLPDGDRFPVCLWARKVESAERGIIVSGVANALPLSVWDRLVKSSERVFPEAKTSVYRTFHVPCDLYSLGMLLVRALLVNEQQTIGQVEEALRRVVNGLDPVVQGIDQHDDKALSERISSRLKDEGTVFSKSAIMYQRDDQHMAPSLLSDNLWYDALILVLKLVSWIPGFSICRSYGIYDSHRVDAHAEQVLLLAEHLGDQIKTELFGSRQRNREILRACDRVRNELVGIRNAS